MKKNIEQELPKASVVNLNGWAGGNGHYVGVLETNPVQPGTGTKMGCLVSR